MLIDEIFITIDKKSNSNNGGFRINNALFLEYAVIKFINDIFISIYTSLS